MRVESPELELECKWFFVYSMRVSGRELAEAFLVKVITRAAMDELHVAVVDLILDHDA